MILYMHIILFMLFRFLNLLKQNISIYFNNIIEVNFNNIIIEILIILHKMIIVALIFII